MEDQLYLGLKKVCFRLYEIFKIWMVGQIIIILIIRDYHIGILVIACSINPRLHYQAQDALGLIMIEGDTKGDDNSPML